MSEGRKIKARCPACRSKSFELYESFEEIEIREVRDGILLREAIDHQSGTSLGLYARCDCGHIWTPRRSSIED